MRYKYEINQNNEILIWDLESPNEYNAPFLFQPNWPNGTAWKDKNEAQQWAEILIDSLLKPDSEFIPGFSPEEPKRLRNLNETEEN